MPRRDDRRGGSGFFETQDRVGRNVEWCLAVLDVGQDHLITQAGADGSRQPPAPYAESLAGLVGRVTFHNDENGFAVLQVKAKEHHDLVTVVGCLASVRVGEWVPAECCPEMPLLAQRGRVPPPTV